MKVIRSLSESDGRTPSVVTVGNFDGLHRGHQAILATVRRRATELGLQSVAITFEPHPLVCIAPERAPIPISTVDQKISLIEATGIDVLLIQAFTHSFSQISPQRFIETHLVEVFQARVVCVGHNFRFGHKHRGDLQTLRSSHPGFTVTEVAPVLHGGQAISSSRVRSGILSGEVREARRMLGRCYEIEGAIVAGLGRGRKLTVPTLNLAPNNALLPEDGVYLTQIAISGDSFADALTNVGVRPTFGDGIRTVETHLIDGVPPEGAGRARVRFLRRIREEREFADSKALRAQIQADVDQARRFFNRFQRSRGGKALEWAAEDRL